jgi:hypothetical protein
MKYLLSLSALLFSFESLAGQAYCGRLDQNLTLCATEISSTSGEVTVSSSDGIKVSCDAAISRNTWTLNCPMTSSLSVNGTDLVQQVVYPSFYLGKHLNPETNRPQARLVFDDEAKPAIFPDWIMVSAK